MSTANDPERKSRMAWTQDILDHRVQLYIITKINLASQIIAKRKVTKTTFKTLFNQCNSIKYTVIGQENKLKVFLKKENTVDSR